MEKRKYIYINLTILNIYIINELIVFIQAPISPNDEGSKVFIFWYIQANPAHQIGFVNQAFSHLQQEKRLQVTYFVIVRYL